MRVSNSLCIILALLPLAVLAEDDVTSTNHPNITTVSGVTYERCRVTNVQPDGISISHSRGVATIPFTDLPQSIQEMGYALYSTIYHMLYVTANDCPAIYRLAVGSQLGGKTANPWPWMCGG